MPKQQSPFIGLISALLPIFVASAIFIQVSNTNPALKQKVNNILGVKSNSESQVNTIKTKSNLARQNYNYTVSETNSDNSKKNVLAAETTSPVVNLIPANNNTTTNSTSSTTSTATSNNSGSTHYGITSTDKKNMMSYILDNIKQIQDKLDPASLQFNKIKINGRENSPALDSIGKNNAYLWINQDKNKLYLKGQGGTRIELLTSKFFARDLRFKGDINILESLNVVGDANVDSNVTIGGTLDVDKNTTLESDALIKGNFQVDGESNFLSSVIMKDNLTVEGISSLGAATLANTNINGTLNVEALLSGVTAKFSGNLSAGSASLTGLLTGTTANFSGNVNLSGTGSTLGNAFFSSPLATNTFTFLGGTISSSDIILTNLLSGNNAKFTGNVSMGSAYLTNNLSAATVQLSGLLSGNSANFIGNVNLSGTGSTLGNAFFSSPLATNTFTFLGGTISSSDIILTNLLSGNNASFSGNVTVNSLSIGNAEVIYLSGNDIVSNLGSGINYKWNINNANEMLLNSSSLNLQNNNLIGVNNLSAASAKTNSIIIGNNSESQISYGSLTPNSLTLSSPSQIHLFNQTGIYFYSGPNNVIAEFGTVNTKTKFYQDVTIVGNLELNSNSTLAAQYFSNPAEYNSAPRVVVSNATYRMGLGPAISDERLKTNTRPTENSLSVIKQLHPVSFNLRNLNDLSQTSPERQIGLIAQEVGNIFPYLVQDTVEIKGTWYKGLDYSRLTAILVGGMQEQQGQIETLSNAIGALNLSSLQDLYNKFNTALENLSMSTEDGKLVVNSGLTVTGDALFNNAKFTGNVQVGQIKVDSLENDISIKASPCVDMDGNINEATCDTNKISIMKNKAGNIEMFDGKVKIKPNGNVLGEKVQAKAFSNSDSSTPSNSDSCTAKDFKFGEKDGKAYIFYCTSDSKWVRSELSSY